MVVGLQMMHSYRGTKNRTSIEPGNISTWVREDLMIWHLYINRIILTTEIMTWAETIIERLPTTSHNNNNNTAVCIDVI